MDTIKHKEKEKKASGSGRLASKIEKVSLSLDPANWDPPAPFFSPVGRFLICWGCGTCGLPLNKPGAVLPLLFTDSSNYTLGRMQSQHVAPQVRSLLGPRGGV